ncbi:PstC family ABC transporter permease [Desulfolutivibrio sulfodismutans]|nr:ABC transporter permease subunit [Desulfolutivibrio sulfodismutans]
MKTTRTAAGASPGRPAYAMPHVFPPSRRAPRGEALVRRAFQASGFAALLAVATVFVFLAVFTLPMFTSGGIFAVLSPTWNPVRNQFGILSMAAATFGLSLSAFALAYPLGVGVCLFLNGLGPRRVAGMLRTVVRLMTAVPTVVYGFVAAATLVPAVRGAFGGSGFSWLSAMLVLTLLILPTVVLILDGEMVAVAGRTRLTAAALGLGQGAALLFVVLPGCRRGLFAAAALGFGRAVGDALIPLMLAGNAVALPRSLLDSMRPLTSHIALVAATDSTSLAYASLFACGMILFCVTAGVNLALAWVRRDTPRGDQA